MKLYTLLGSILALASTVIHSSDNDSEGYFEIKIPALTYIETTQKSLDFATRNLITMGISLNRTLENLPEKIATIVEQKVEKTSKEIKKELNIRPKQIGIVAVSTYTGIKGGSLLVDGIKSAICKENGEIKIKPGLDTAYYIGAGTLLSVAGFFGIINSDTIAEFTLSDIVPSFLKK